MLKKKYRRDSLAGPDSEDVYCREAGTYVIVFMQKIFILMKKLWICTATKEEHLERYGWWISELESLGLSVNKINEFNELNEIRSLVEIIKEGFYQNQKSHNLQL
jgi:type III secretory pathway component EscU